MIVGRCDEKEQEQNTMTNISSLICAILFVITACQQSSIPAGDTSRNSLDWQGTYHGVLPCADCPGILTTIELNDDNTYVMYTTYLDRDGAGRRESGSFAWDRSGGKITLQLPDGVTNPMYQVGENKLIALPPDGSRITGALADRYVLTKDNNDIENKYWKLTHVNGEKVVWRENQRREAHIILHPADSTVTGNGGCNSLRGKYELTSADRISFSPLAVTKMACMDNMDVENQMLKALNEASSYKVNGDSLFLFDNRKTKSATFAVVYLR